jgi:orotidine-5'-phosphate decarboxylase
MSDAENFLRAPRGIILAADMDGLKELRRVLSDVSVIPEIAAIKLGFSLALRAGLSVVVNTVREISPLPIIYDHQKAGTDIPQMGRPFAVLCRDAGVIGVIFFPQAGPKTFEAFVSGAIDENLIPIVGLVMSHPAYLQSEGGYIVDDAPKRMAEKALQLGVTNFVLPGTKPKVVREFARGLLINTQVTIMMPGIGSQGGSLQEACTACTPHRSYPIIGSAIYGAENPLNAAMSFAEQLKDAQRI